MTARNASVPIIEQLEPRLLLDVTIPGQIPLDQDLANQTIQLFNVAPTLFVENQGQWQNRLNRLLRGEQCQPRLGGRLRGQGLVQRLTYVIEMPCYFGSDRSRLTSRRPSATSFTFERFILLGQILEFRDRPVGAAPLLDGLGHSKGLVSD